MCCRPNIVLGNLEKTPRKIAIKQSIVALYKTTEQGMTPYIRHPIPFLLQIASLTVVVLLEDGPLF